MITIELPQGSPPPTGREAALSTSAPALGKSILVVDDERDVASLLIDLLSRDGHVVETAENGEAALQKLMGRHYDLILSDIRMPALDGPSLYREVEQFHPDLRHRIIFITGDMLSERAQEFLERTTALTVAKPFTLEELRRAIDRALEAS